MARKSLSSSFNDGGTKVIPPKTSVIVSGTTTTTGPIKNNTSEKSDVDYSALEKKISSLEERLDASPKGVVSSHSVSKEELPELAPRKTSSLYDRMDSLEKRLEALIEQLAK